MYGLRISRSDLYYYLDSRHLKKSKMPTHTKTYQNFINTYCNFFTFYPTILLCYLPAIEDDISSSFGRGVIGSRSSKSQILTVLSSDPETKTLSSGAMAKQLIPSSWPSKTSRICPFLSFFFWRATRNFFISTNVFWYLEIRMKRKIKYI